MREAQLKQLHEDGDENAAADLYRESQMELVTPRGKGLPPQVVALDFETYYSKDYSLKPLGVERYVNDPRFDAYLVAFAAPDLRWVGHPKDAPWDQIHARIWLAHNMAFERAVVRRLKADGVIPEDVCPVMWQDTAALAAYLQAPRDLGGAARTLLNRELDKTVRQAIRQ